jgi:hypothetical protein
MSLLLRLTLCLLCGIFAVAVLLGVLPVRSRVQESGRVVTSAGCGSIVTTFGQETSDAQHPGCTSALAHRRSLILSVAIAGLTICSFTVVFPLIAARRGRCRDASDTTEGGDPPTATSRHLNDLERLIRLRDSGAVTDAAFEVHRAGILLRANHLVPSGAEVTSRD